MKTLACLVLLVFNLCVEAQESTCYGTTSNGRLEHGVKLPGSGVNFKSYGSLPNLIGRTYVHSKVRQIVAGAYKDLETDAPDKIYKYAETGLKNGGPFKPHKTHHNGLSVDFMVPVTDSKERSVHLPSHAFNKYGYDIEFDNQGRYKQYKIDFEAMGAHIVALHKAAKKSGAGIWRVLFAPELQISLKGSKYGSYIRDNIPLSNKRSWVRHDEHYHVDFSIECKPL